MNSRFLGFSALGLLATSPPLPEDLARWPGCAIEALVALNKLRRSQTPSERDNETARECIAHIRVWWKYSTAWQSPQKGKEANALRAGIEPALLALNKLKARLVRVDGGAAIQVSELCDESELKKALESLGLSHLPIQRANQAKRLAA